MITLSGHHGGVWQYRSVLESDLPEWLAAHAGEGWETTGWPDYKPSVRHPADPTAIVLLWREVSRDTPPAPLPPKGKWPRGAKAIK